jgi:hypothetical protein
MMLFVTGIVVFLISSAFRFDNLFFEMAKSMGFVFLFFGLLYCEGWFNDEETRLIKEKLVLIRTALSRA